MEQQNKTIANGYYTFKKQLGKGQFGSVHLATTPEGQIVAIK